jgi:hypothetical protein
METALRISAAEIMWDVIMLDYKGRHDSAGFSAGEKLEWMFN